MPRKKQKSPRKSRVARERPRGVDGLFLSASGHRKSTGRYVGMSSFLQEAAEAAYTRLDALHDHRFRLDAEKVKLEQQRSLRGLDQKRDQLASEQRALEEKGQQTLREAEERAARERADTERRVAEQCERLAEQQIDREKRLADQQIQSTEAWVKTLTPVN